MRRLKRSKNNLSSKAGPISSYDEDCLEPVMPAIDVVQQIIEEEKRTQSSATNSSGNESSYNSESNQDSTVHGKQSGSSSSLTQKINAEPIPSTSKADAHNDTVLTVTEVPAKTSTPKVPLMEPRVQEYSRIGASEEEESLLVVRNPLHNFAELNDLKKQEEYEFIPKSVVLDVYSNDPEVERFLKQLTKIGIEYGYNEQDYKCYSCRRPIGMVFGQSRLCHFDGHHYCTECHLGDKATIPARILCNWDFNKYPVSKRNQHFLNLISNEPMFELKTLAPLLYKTCPELREIEDLRCQAFFVRSYCSTCVQDSISLELAKLVWPREHLVKQADIYSLEDLNQIKSGALKQVLKSVISFGKQHVLSCMLCCQKGFICELCNSSQIIYPFDTAIVYRCIECQCIYHKVCFSAKSGPCPRCQRLAARRSSRT